MERIEKCSECYYWHTHEEGGECRLNPPAIVPKLSGEGRWPITYGDEWCGKFKSERGTAIASSAILGRKI
jgi:hypothetical protein